MIIKGIKFIYTPIQIDMHIFLMWVNLRSLECILRQDLCHILTLHCQSSINLIVTHATKDLHEFAANELRYHNLNSVITTVG